MKYKLYENVYALRMGRNLDPTEPLAWRRARLDRENHRLRRDVASKQVSQVRHRHTYLPRRDGAPEQVSQVRHKHTYIHTPREERNNDFLKSIREINNLIVAQHHLHNVSIKTYPASIIRKEQELMNLIRPAKPTERTLMLLEGNTKKWSYNTVLILAEHYSTLIENTKKDLSECLTLDHLKAFSIASKWARKNLGKRLKPKTLDTVRVVVTDLYNTQTHTQTTPTHPTPQVPLPPPPSSPSTDIADPGEGPSRTTGTATPRPELTQEDFPDLPAPEEPWTPVGRRGNHGKQRTPNRSTPQPERNTEEQQNPGNTPRPQREHSTRRRTTPPSTTAQRTSLGMRNNRGNHTTPETPTEDTATQRGTPAQEETNGTAPRKPGYWRSGGKAEKHKWRFVANKDIIILGDSNLARIPTITDDRIQIESYSGMNLEWAETVLRKTEINEKATHLILSVGINNKHQKQSQTSITALRKLRNTARTKFPNADRRIALINFSESLPEGHKGILRSLNEEIKKEPYVPKLTTANFQTEPDNVHWKKDTAEAMLQHWISSLN